MFFLIDKPLGITSFDVIRKLRKILNTRKIGHAGTLDPLATGCLLIATDNSTKLLHLIDDSKKEYIFTVSLKGKSDSLDKGTKVTETSLEGYIPKNDTDISEFLLSQKTQIPPKYSALHIGGERAYALARSGIDFTIKEREISVHEVEIIKNIDFEITIRIILSSGGYVRSFAPILGRFFGIDGGYITDLRRTKIITKYGALEEAQLSNINNPEEISYGKIFHTIPTYEISNNSLTEILLGRTILLNKINSISDKDLVFIENKNTSFLGVGILENGIYTIIKNNV